MAYTKTTWVNGSAPAINAANLQNIENALADLNNTAATRTILTVDADTVDGVNGAAVWYSSSGTGGSDGNGGQPPAPKPRVGSTDADIGRFRKIAFADGADAVLPSGGAWAYMLWRYNAAYESVASPLWYFNIGMEAGGSTILGGEAGRITVGMIWRVA